MVRTRIIKIGNSQGIRIPKPLLEDAGLEGEVELEPGDRQIVIRSIQNPRQGWNDAFREMGERGDDDLIDGDLPNLTDWDEKEWEW